MSAVVVHLADVRARPRVTRPVRLFAFHHAGGSTASFAGWQRRLGPRVEVVPVRLPDREGPGGGPHRDLAPLARALHQQLGAQLDEPYLCYGHSMGALVAYHLVRFLAATGRRLPKRLLVGAHPAPHLPLPLESALLLDDAELAHRLAAFDGLPTAVSGTPDRLADYLAQVRAGLELCTSRRHTGDSYQLPCPIDVFAGADDPLVAVEDAAAWCSHSLRGGTLQVIPGGHFFQRQSKDAFFTRLAAVIDLHGGVR
ncbi:thioesterase II family protein [Kitasatospora sp. NPDC056531]|uniref:thioesterase II family protein n=1 Tax=Kitasatospora sp. NPDC056531 TaxID=3345856 RepID=UPI0036AB7874